MCAKDYARESFCTYCSVITVLSEKYTQIIYLRKAKHELNLFDLILGGNQLYDIYFP